MDDTGVESPKNLGQFPRYGHGNRKVAAAEVMYCRKAYHVRLILGSAFEEGGNYQNTMAHFAEFSGETFDAPSHPTHMGCKGVGKHKDIHWCPLIPSILPH